ncbi:MAG: glutamate--tRNA ligase [Legionellales bacterium]|nr:glutamate--tRNA ligase [Legionellales bacterium]
MKTRFCPSPTGSLHIGNMRTALFNYLCAKKCQGTFLLRIEDTDLARSKDIYQKAIQDDLLALGLKWDEGISDIDNDEYVQSNRQAIYEKYYAKLLEAGNAYYCFCSDEELKVSRKLQLSQGLPPKYNGKCRDLSKQDIEQALHSGKKPTIRFLVSRNINVEFEDKLRGKQVFNSNIIGDFIIKKADGMASFMFANAIDDALMGVTHVLRGEDHLTNTPRQKLILDTLGLNNPCYVHISIILGEDRQPLSKRNGSQSIQALLDNGYLPIAVLNYLARIGHVYDKNELLSLEKLAEHFLLDKLVKSPAVFDIEQLNNWQKSSVLDCSNDEFEEKYLKNISLNISSEQKNKLVLILKNNILFPTEANDWIELLFNEKIEYDKEHLEILRNAGKEFFNIWINLIDENNLDIKILYAEINGKLGIKGKQIYMPIRIATTNRKHGPELQNIFDVIGITILKKKIMNIIELI